MSAHECPLVLVEWQDSVQPSWSYLQDYDAAVAVQCVSVGWLIHDGEVKALAQNFGNLQIENNAQVSGVIHFPARCITRLTQLQEPSFTSDPFSHPETAQKQPAS